MLPYTAGATVGPIYSGIFRLMHTYDDSGVGTDLNLFFGANSGNFSTTGTGMNTCLGASSMTAITTASLNNSMGFESLKLLTEGVGNVSMGHQSSTYDSGGGTGSALTTGDYNVNLGYRAGASGADADVTIAIGKHARVEEDNQGAWGGTGADAIRLFIGATDTDSTEDWIYANVGSAKGGICLAYDDADGSPTNFAKVLVDSAGIGYLESTNNYWRIPLDGKLQLGDDAVSVWSDDDGFLDLTADTGIRFNSPYGMFATNTKLYFRDTDISINSANDGDLDLDADSGIDLNAPSVDTTGYVKITGGQLDVGKNDDTDADVNLMGDNGTQGAVVDFFNAANEDTNADKYTIEADGDVLNIGYAATDLHLTYTGYLRADAARYRRYYHLPLSSFDPGASGATWTDPSANTVGGWYLNADTEQLFFDADIHDDWDGASDITVEVYFQVREAVTINTDEVDLQLISYYMGTTESATKSQTDQVDTVTDGTDYKMYKAEFTITYNPGGGDDWEAGDIWRGELTWEASSDTQCIITNASYYYNTTHIGIESGDV